jgi:hypothetical protein
MAIEVKGGRMGEGGAQERPECTRIEGMFSQGDERTKRE